MSHPQFDEILRKTLEDRRVSRGEKRVLQQILQQLADGGLSEQQIGLLRQRAFEVARNEVADPHAREILSWLEDIVKIVAPAGSGGGGPSHPTAQAYFTPGDDCPQAIQRLLDNTVREVDICVFTITDDRISRAIEAAHQRGVQVRIISDDEKAGDLGSDIDRLRGVGIPVRVDLSPYHMHHKFAIFDAAVTLTGSYNWTRSAAETNEENLVVYRDQRLARTFSSEFERLWQECR